MSLTLTSQELMDISSRLSAQSVRLMTRKERSRVRAFSLVEIVISLAVISFTFVTLIGLLGVGSLSFRNANTTSVATQIGQRVINELQQTDFTDLTNGAPSGVGAVFTKQTPAGQSVRYFDDQGDEIVTQSEFTKSVYQVNTRIAAATLLPQTAGSTVYNPDLATVTVQVANAPGVATLPFGSSSLLWASGTTNNISTFSTLVPMNKNL
jgi:uncharacterized protein (TIGR02598 family)